MGRWGRVKKLLDGNAFEDAILSLAGDAAGGAKDAAGWAVNQFLDTPYQKEWFGDIQYGVARYGPPDKILDTINRIGGDETRVADVLKAHEKGYNGRSGGRAVWELMQEDNPRLLRAAADIGIDPTTYLSLGSGAVAKGVIKAGVTQAAKGGIKNQVAGTALKGTGRVAMAYSYPDILVDKLGANVISKFAKTRPGQYITGDSERTALRREFDKAYTLVSQVFSRDAGTLQDEGRAAVAGRFPGISGPLDPNQNYRGNLKTFQAIAGNDHNDEIIGRLGNWINSTNKRKLTPQDIDKLSDIKIERGPFAGQTISGPVIDAFGRVEKDIDEIQSLMDPNNPGFVKRGKGNGARVAEIQARYGDMENIGKVADPLTWPKMREIAIRQNLESDPTIPSLSFDENEWLSGDRGRKVAGWLKGNTNLESMRILINRFNKDRMTILDDIDPTEIWRAGERDWEAQAHKLTDKNAVKAYKYWTSAGVDPIHSDQIDAAFEALQRETFVDRGLEAKYKIDQSNMAGKLKAIYGEAVDVWKATALFSPRYHTSSIAGTYFNTILRHGPEAFKIMGGPDQVVREFQQIRKDPSLIHQMHSERLRNIADDFGLASKTGPTIINKNISSMGSIGMVGGNIDATERLFKRLRMRPVGKILNKGFAVNRQFGLAVDSNYRSALWSHGITTKFEELQPELVRGIREYAQKTGVDMSNAAPLPFKDPVRALGYYKQLGFTEGQARHLSRMVAEARNKADAHGVNIVHKTLFSYYKTPLDEALENFVPFHYYATRATMMYTEEVMRNPFLMVNLARGMQELSSSDQNMGLNARQRGWIQILSGPAGYSLLLNPDALLGFTKSIGMMESSGYDTEGETELGTVLKWMKSSGLGLYPWIDGAFNMVGAYGDTFEPDMLGIRHRALVGALVNMVSAEMGADGMTNAWYAEASARAREKLSTSAASFLPGWMSSPVPAKANQSGTLAEATLEKAIENRIITNHPGITYEQLFQYMNDPDSDEYQRAFIDVSRSGFASQLLSFIAPTGVKFRDDAADVRTAKIGAVYDYASEHNGDFDPSGDAEFAARYKKDTGNDWKIIDFKDTQFRDEMAKASPESRPFILAEYQYRKIGTPGAKSLRDTYNGIRYGGIVPKGFDVPEKGKEKDLADNWLSQQSPEQQAEYEEMYVLQGAFKLSHPEYGAYLEWRSQLGYLTTLVGDAGYSIYREQVSKGNPNARRYFESRIITARKRFGSDSLKATEWLNEQTTTAEAWMAVTGMAKTQRDVRPAPLSDPRGISYDPAQQLVEQATPWNDNASSGQSAPPMTESAKFLSGF